MRTKLQANTRYEKRILEYIEGFASDVLVEKINTGDKTMKGCMDYIIEQAKSMREGNCAVVDDAKVYGWAMHYFEEDSIVEGTTKKPAVSDRKTFLHDPKTGKPKEAVKEVSKDLPGQMDMFAFLGGTS